MKKYETEAIVEPRVRTLSFAIASGNALSFVRQAWAHSQFRNQFWKLAIKPLFLIVLDIELMENAFLKIPIVK